jgi:hypothetical protein
LTIDTFAVAFTVSLSLAEPVAPLGASVAVTVFTSGFVVRLDANATGTVNVSPFAAPPAIVAFVALKLDWPAPPATVPHVAVPAGVQVTLPDSVTPAGSVSLTLSCVAVARRRAARRVGRAAVVFREREHDARHDRIGVARGVVRLIRVRDDARWYHGRGVRN